MQYQIDTGNLEALRAAFARAPELVVREMTAAVTEADNLLLREVKDKMPIGGQGFLRQSVFNEERVSETGVLGMVATPLRYAEPVELGTKPPFPPLQPLVDWVLHSPVGQSTFRGAGGKALTEKTARGVAFLIARKISRSGTKAQRPFGIARQENEAQVLGMFEAALGRIANQLAGAN